MQKKTLLEDLYIELKANLKICKNRDFLTDLVFPYYEEFSGKKTLLSRSEIYNEARDNDFRDYAPYIMNEHEKIAAIDNKTWETIRKEQIASFVKICISEEYLGRLKGTLIELLNETNVHNDKVLCKKMISMMERLQILKKVQDNIEKRWFDGWVDALYYYFYFAVTDKLHFDIAFTAYPELENDLEEYNNKVTMMYGVCGNPGMYQLYSMAERENPNIIALYECGELEYYGKGPSGKVNYQKAYEFYEKTRECNTEHPLATWSIAYMKFHYSQEKAAKESEYRVQEFEDELIGGKRRNSWYDSIILNAQSSYRYGCAAAANLIGKILDSKEEEFPASRRGDFKHMSAKQFYKESADGGYVYGCNNYANVCIKEANETNDIELKINLMQEAAYYLEKSANLGNPWAANKYATYCINGLCVEESVIVEKNIDKAYELLKYALVMIYSEKYYWPLINLCKYYWLDSGSKVYLEQPLKKISDYVVEAMSEVADQNQLRELEEISSTIKKMENGDDK